MTKEEFLTMFEREMVELQDQVTALDDRISEHESHDQKTEEDVRIIAEAPAYEPVSTPVSVSTTMPAVQYTDPVATLYSPAATPVPAKTNELETMVTKLYQINRLKVKHTLKEIKWSPEMDFFFYLNAW